MGNCWCFKTKPKKKIVLLLLGLDNAGKTVTVKGLAGESRHLVIPTVGFSLYKLEYRNCNINIYDLGGGPQIRGIWHLYYADAHGVIFVVDASDYRRLNETRDILEELLTNDKLSGKPVLLLANKQDVSGALDELDIVEKLKLEDLVNQQRCPTLVKSCSATEETATSKFDKGIHQGYIWLLNLILRDYWKLNGRVERDVREQRARNIAVRKAIVDRVNTVESHRSTPASIEWDTGCGDRILHISRNTTGNKVPDSYEARSSDVSSRASSSSWGSQPSTPRVYFENAVTHEIPTLFQEEDANIPPPIEKVASKRRKIFRRSNKTAPVTLLGVSPINANTRNMEHVDTITRRLKSAEMVSTNSVDPISRQLKSAGSNNPLQVLSVNHFADSRNGHLQNVWQANDLTANSSGTRSKLPLLKSHFTHSATLAHELRVNGTHMDSNL